MIKPSMQYRPEIANITIQHYRAKADAFRKAARYLHEKCYGDAYDIEQAECINVAADLTKMAETIDKHVNALEQHGENAYG